MGCLVKVLDIQLSNLVFWFVPCWRKWNKIMVTMDTYNKFVWVDTQLLNWEKNAFKLSYINRRWHDLSAPNGIVPIWWGLYKNNSRIQFYYLIILLLTGGVSGLYIYFCLLFELLSIAQNERFKAILLPLGTESSL